MKNLKMRRRKGRRKGEGRNERERECANSRRYPNEERWTNKTGTRLRGVRDRDRDIRDVPSASLDDSIIIWSRVDSWEYNHEWLNHHRFNYDYNFYNLRSQIEDILRGSPCWFVSLMKNHLKEFADNILLLRGTVKLTNRFTRLQR